jgi:hypothetical protein
MSMIWKCPDSSQPVGTVLRTQASHSDRYSAVDLGDPARALTAGGGSGERPQAALPRP